MLTKLIHIALLFIAMSIGQATAVSAVDKQIVGWVEIASIYPGNIKIKAKLDTGADHSSLNGKNIQYFRREDESWVRFEFRNVEDRLQVFEAKVIRTTQIKRLGQDATRRPTIKLGICIGNTHKEAEVNLADRTGYNYQMLIGRSFLKGLFLIDPEVSLVSRMDCNRIKGE